VNGGFLFESADILDEVNVPKAGEKVSQTGDIVFTSKGTVGRFGFVKPTTPRFVYSPQLCYWRVLDRSILDPRFLLYWMQGSDFLNQVHQVKGLTDMADYVSLSDQRRMSVSAPTISVQGEIASILSVYDDLIENNTRRIRILEEMAQMIYREWFVNFRFPGHEKVKMVESEMGPIPKGWSAKTLGDVLQLEYGKALKADDRTGGSVAVYGSSGVVGYHNQKLVEGPGIIVGRKGNVGSVFFCESDFWVIDTAYYVCTSVPLHFVYFNLQTQNFLNNDAAVPGLNRNQALSLPVALPDPRNLEKFGRLVEPMFKLKYCLERRNANLRQTRDLLLPKLISGEVSVENPAGISHPAGTLLRAAGRGG
jgi:type I restriction enzyme S subunit